MLNINNHYYAENNEEFCSQLFDKELPRFEGTYEKMKDGIKLFNEKGELFAFIVNNGCGKNFFVTASMHDGNIFYMYSLNELGEKRLGMESLGFTAGIELAESIVKKVYEE